MKKTGGKPFFALLFLLFTGGLFAENASYTYNYDWWTEYQASPDAYEVGAYILGTRFGIGDFRDPQGLFIRENRIYICDSGNNRIVLIEALEDGGYELKTVVSSVRINGAESPFNYPRDIFETPEGEIYIADTNNQRVLRLDRDWGFLAEILKPENETIDETADFLPSKLVVDSAGRLYLQAVNVNKGLMEFDGRGVFQGYLGANKVSVNLIDFFWKSIATKEQRAAMELFVPTEYNNLYLDGEDFIYATTRFSMSALRNGADVEGEMKKTVRRLNATGKDILVRSDDFPVIGDYQFVGQTSQFIDITALENDSYACFDQTRGRIFVYGNQDAGRILYAFGGLGNREGYFSAPAALDHLGFSLFALDARMGSLTRFDLTGYGELINAALAEYKEGRFDESARLWEETLRVNGNYDIAYIGIARAALQKGDYKKAMDYFRLKRFDTGYSKAFQAYRKQWVEEHLRIILIILGLLIVVPPAWRFILQFKREIQEP